jgi:hypothetical protein
VNKFATFLSKTSTYRVLLLVNIAAGILVFFFFRNSASGDEQCYLNLADGLLRGKYSPWYFLQDYPPDTFRNPGYPLFIALFRIFTTNVMVIKVGQLFLYFISVFLLLDISVNFRHSILIRSLFLLILLPSFQVVIFTTMIIPESLVTFLLSLYLWFCFNKPLNTYLRAIILGLLCGYIFQVRPVFLLFPVVKFFSDWKFRKEDFSLAKQSVVLWIFVLSMLPYGFWNLKFHNHFSVTSLEGGGGNLYFGYWSYKMPGYVDTNYWKGNRMSKEPIRFVSDDEAASYYEKFNAEWDSIQALAVPLLTSADSARLAIMNKKEFSDIPQTFSSEYTLKRDQLMKSVTMDHYIREPIFFLKTRLFTIVRLWFTGVQKDSKDTGLHLIAKYYPFLVSFFAFILAVIFVPVAMIKKKISFYEIFFIGAIVLYWGLIHAPFSLQARYTIPVRLELFLLISFSITPFLTKEKIIHQAG